MTTIIDQTILAEAKETMKAKFPTIVAYFLEDSEVYIDNIKEGISAVNIEKIVSPAHTLKSSARQMGAILVSEIAKEIEHLAREQIGNGANDVQVFGELLPKLEAAFAETKDAFAQQSV